MRHVQAGHRQPAAHTGGGAGCAGGRAAPPPAQLQHRLRAQLRRLLVRLHPRHVRRQLLPAGLRDLPPTGAGVLRAGKPVRQVGAPAREAPAREAPGKSQHF